MAGKLSGKRIAILATDGVEEVELTQPRDAVTAEGAQVDVISLEEGELQAMNHDIEPASTFPVDKTAAQASPSDYDALILPAPKTTRRVALATRRVQFRYGRVLFSLSLAACSTSPIPFCIFPSICLPTPFTCWDVLPVTWPTFSCTFPATSLAVPFS